MDRAVQAVKTFFRPRDINIQYIFALFVYINLWNFIDRGIIPGSSVEFDNFIQDSTHSSSPNALLGFLQSSFIVGFVIGSAIFSTLVHRYGALFVIRSGVTVWMVSVVLCGFSRIFNSYYFLIFCRMLSGMGEASLQCTLPPWVQSRAPSEHKGWWLSIYYTCFPVGTAIGYTYSSFISASIGWEFAYFIEALCMAPFYLCLFVIPQHAVDDQPLDSNASTADESSESSKQLQLTEASSSSSTTTSPSEPVKPPTMLEETVIVTRNALYNFLILGNAAQTAVVVGLSTFGSSFLMSFGFYDTESDASTMFGILISLAGIFGVPAGGWYIDFLVKRQKLIINSAQNSTKNEEENETRSPLSIEKALEEEIKDEQKIIATTDEQTRAALFDIILFQLTWASILAAFLFSILYIVYNKGLFLFFIVLGCFMLFFTYTGIYMGVMMAVPEQNRPYGIAFCSIISHAFGDVPSPIIVGWLKDYLAPDCVGEGDDDNVAASEECRDEADGLRLTFLLTSLWLCVTVFFFSLAWFWNKRRKAAAESEDTQRIIEHEDSTKE